MSNVKATFRPETLQLIGEVCDNTPCIECHFNAFDLRGDDYGRCMLIDVNGRPPYIGWELEDDRMEDDLK